MRKYRIGVDLGGTNIAAGIVDEEFSIVKKASVKTDVAGGAEKICRDIDSLCRSVCAEAGIPYDGRLVRSVTTKAGAISRQLESLDAANIGYDGIFAFSDLLAYETMNSLSGTGKDVPIVGIDHIRKDLFYMPPLDSVGAAGKSMSEEAVRMLMNAIKTGGLCRDQICLDVKLYPSGK